MKKSGWLGIRLEPEIEDALINAATDNDRAKAAMGRIILKEWLKEHGYLEGEQPRRAHKKA